MLVACAPELAGYELSFPSLSDVPTFSTPSRSSDTVFDVSMALTQRTGLSKTISWGYSGKAMKLDVADIDRFADTNI